MGGRKSKPEPPPSPLFPRAWRTLPWGENKNKQHVEQFRPEKVKHLRVLLYGPVGAGKSSFINSISSTLQGEVTNPAGASAITSDKSHTKKYKTYKIKKENSNAIYPIVFSDMMGLEDGPGNGVRVEDIKLAMMGHVNDNYTFNPVSALSQGNPGYNPFPTLDDKVHVVVCVHSANSAEIKESVLRRMKEIREIASDLDIPQIAVITKVDEACAETEKDLENVYRSKHIKKKMSDFSSTVGIPMNCIFPIQNYFEETSTNSKVNDLILVALKQIISCGELFLNTLHENNQSVSSVHV